MSLQSFDAVILYQDFHLADGDGVGICQPLGLTPKRIEFDTVKIRVVECFPHTEEFDGVSVAKPVLNDVPWIVIILDFCNVCQAEKVITLEIPLHIDLCSANN